jgi:Na+/H+-dicarboxylate symporter
MHLWKKVLIGLILGCIAGFIMGPQASMLKPIGDVFIRLIKMIIVPLILCAVISGVSSIGETTKLGRIGLKAAVAYFVTTVFAVCIGLGTGVLLKPGQGFKLPQDFSSSTVPASTFSILDSFLDIIPDNIFGAMSSGNILQVVFFAIFAAICINKLGSEGDRVSSFFKSFSVLIFKMISLIVQLSPYAAFALTAALVGSQGKKVLQSLSYLIVCGMIAFLLQYIVFGLLIRVFAKVSPIPFYKKSIEYQTIAFSSSSSKAALTTTMSVCKNKLGVSQTGSSFILPLGATINMDGLAIYLGLCAVFVAQATGVELTMANYATIIATCTIGSIGGAGIPSAALIFIPIVLGSVGLPVEGVALIAGIDRIMDMMRTTVSITGDAAVTVVVDAWEGLLDKKSYNA